MKRRRISLLLCTALVLAVLGCSRTDDPVKIVRRYNDAVILAYRTGDTSKLVDVAGEREARIVGVLVTTKRGAGLVMEAALERLEVVQDRITGPDARVIDANEEWRYYDRPLRPGSSPGQTINAAMKVEYECERSGNVWKVMKVKVLENTFADQKKN